MEGKVEKTAKTIRHTPGKENTSKSKTAKQGHKSMNNENHEPLDTQRKQYFVPGVVSAWLMSTKPWMCALTQNLLNIQVTAPLARGSKGGGGGCSYFHKYFFYLQVPKAATQVHALEFLFFNIKILY